MYCRTQHIICPHPVWHTTCWCHIYFPSHSYDGPDAPSPQAPGHLPQQVSLVSLLACSSCCSSYLFPIPIPTRVWCCGRHRHSTTTLNLKAHAKYHHVQVTTQSYVPGLAHDSVVDGAYLELSLHGSSITPDHSSNQALYGDMSPDEVGGHKFWTRVYNTTPNVRAGAIGVSA